MISACHMSLKKAKRVTCVVDEIKHLLHSGNKWNNNWMQWKHLLHICKCWTKTVSFPRLLVPDNIRSSWGVRVLWDHCLGVIIHEKEASVKCFTGRLCKKSSLPAVNLDVCVYRAPTAPIASYRKGAAWLSLQYRPSPLHTLCIIVFSNAGKTSQEETEGLGRYLCECWWWKILHS